MSNNLTERTEFILYQTDDDRIRIETRMQDETVWLTQKQMAELFQKDIRTINEHLKNIYAEGELVSESTIRKFRIVRLEGTREVARSIDHYNLDAIISVGYRVNSIRGTQFRIWATQRLREYLIKGFVLDDDSLKRKRMGVASTLLTNGMTDIDQRVRIAAFNWLDEQVSAHGDVLPRSILAKGLDLWWSEPI